METFYEAIPGLLRKSAIALGFFDGVHPGHQAVIAKAVGEAKRLHATASIVTFRDHPRALTRGSHPLLLTVIEQRLELFAKLGVEATLVLSFTEDLCRLSPVEYVERILVDSMGAKSISVGPNHHFGRNREGNPQLLKSIGGKQGFTVHIASMVLIDGLEVSSSRVREWVAEGNMSLAHKLLSRPYAVLGNIVKGQSRGKILGFPTANLSLYEYQLVPGRGVYAGTACLHDGRKLPAVINVGQRPTFQNTPLDPLPTVVEVHILDFDESLYDTKMQVEFHKFLRQERKFDGVENLKKQIAVDCITTRQLVTGDYKL